jgi:ribosomal protein L35AE/L33A
MKKVLVPAVLSLALFACSSTDKEIKEPATSTPSQTTTTVKKELTKEDDVTSIQRVDSSSPSYTEVKVNVENHSSKASNYLIELTATSPDGTKQLGGTFTSVSSLEPNQAAEVKAMFDSNLPADTIFKAVKVTRYAS